MDDTFCEQSHPVKEITKSNITLHIKETFILILFKNRFYTFRSNKEAQAKKFY